MTFLYCLLPVLWIALYLMAELGSMHHGEAPAGVGGQCSVLPISGNCEEGGYVQQQKMTADQYMNVGSTVEPVDVNVQVAAPVSNPSWDVPQSGLPFAYQQAPSSYVFSGQAQQGLPFGYQQGGSSNNFQQFGSPNGIGEVQTGPDGPPCLCGHPSVQRTVQKESQNKGRVFFACGGYSAGRNQCTYFQWADESFLSAEEQQQMRQPPPYLPTAPLCLCREQSVPTCVRKSGPNEGRWFFKCPKLMQKECDFFAWADEPPPLEPPSYLPSAPQCHCQKPSVPVCVRKSGPNEGRWFFKCVNSMREGCDFFLGRMSPHHLHLRQIYQ